MKRETESIQTLDNQYGELLTKYLDACHKQADLLLEVRELRKQVHAAHARIVKARAEVAE